MSMLYEAEWPHECTFPKDGAPGSVWLCNDCGAVHVKDVPPSFCERYWRWRKVGRWEAWRLKRRHKRRVYAT